MATNDSILPWTLSFILPGGAVVPSTTALYSKMSGAGHSLFTLQSNAATGANLNGKGFATFALHPRTALRSRLSGSGFVTSTLSGIANAVQLISRLLGAGQSHAEFSIFPGSETIGRRVFVGATDGQGCCCIGQSGNSFGSITPRTSDFFAFDFANPDQRAAPSLKPGEQIVSANFYTAGTSNPAPRAFDPLVFGSLFVTGPASRPRTVVVAKSRVGATSDVTYTITCVIMTGTGRILEYSAFVSCIGAETL